MFKNNFFLECLAIYLHRLGNLQVQHPCSNRYSRQEQCLLSGQPNNHTTITLLLKTENLHTDRSIIWEHAVHSCQWH